MTAKGLSLQCGGQATHPLDLNMKLRAHHERPDFGGIGEGMSPQKTGTDRRFGGCLYTLEATFR